MVANNKIDQSFGPVGSFAGKLVFFAGIVAVYFSWYSVFLVFVGAFVGFSCSVTEIDFDKKRLRFSNHLFGFIKSGSWVNIMPEMKIGITKSRRTWKSYSGGNRELDVTNEDYRLIL